MADVTLSATAAGMPSLGRVLGSWQPTAGVLGPGLQILVEHRLPCLAMHTGRIGQHAVQIEQAGINLFRQTKRGVGDHADGIPTMSDP